MFPLAGTKRRRAINREILEFKGVQRSRVSEAQPSRLNTCQLQGRRAPEFAGGVFESFCNEVPCPAICWKFHGSGFLILGHFGNT